MTTYSHKIILDDGEIITLKSALEHYRDVCRAELASGPKAPYWAHARSIDAIMGRLYDDVQMTSTNSFNNPKKS